MKYYYLALFLLTSIFCFSQNDQPNRESFELTVKVDEDGFYQQKIDSTPYFVSEGILQIYPGEKIYVEAEMNNGKITNLKTVKSILYPEKTIIIEFEQLAEGRAHKNMILKVQNPFDSELNYSAHMYILNHNKWLETSIIPVFPKLLGYEMWPDIIISIVLKDWELKTGK